jgi:thiamine pyrophosphokinase
MNVFLFLNGVPGSELWYREHYDSVRGDGDRVICADGGYRVARGAGISPDLIIGDLDSVNGEPAALGAKVEQFPADKDYSDFELALHRAEGYAPDRIYVYGAQGGRIDHELTNVLLIAHARVPVVSVERDSEIYAVKDRLVLTGKKGMICSLLALGGPCRIEDMRGFRYCIRNEMLRPSSRGLSNVVTADTATVSLAGGRLVVVVVSSGKTQP